MTFHDEVYADNDKANYQSIRQLQLWLLTIGHLTPETTDGMLSAMENFCNEMGWNLVYDGILDAKVLG